MPLPSSGFLWFWGLARVLPRIRRQTLCFLTAFSIMRRLQKQLQWEGKKARDGVALFTGRHCIAPTERCLKRKAVSENRSTGFKE